MFRDEYIKANEQIKPDDDFLKHLKEVVKNEDKAVHIGDYVDYKNADNFERIDELYIANTTDRMQKHKIVKRVVAIAACLVLVVTVAFVVGKVDLSDGGKGLQAGIDSVVDEMEQEQSKNVVDAECQKQYEKVYDLFMSNNSVIYVIDDFPQDNSGIEYLQELKGGQCELSPSDRDELISNILAEKYILCASLEEFIDVKYYVAEFDNETYVYFAIQSNNYMYIEEVSGVQSLAQR